MKNFLIAGGGSGIGLELVKILSNRGAGIIALGRSPKGLSGVENVEFHEYEVTGSRQQPPEIGKPLNGIIYMPGTINLKPFPMLKEEDFQNDFAVNFLGAVKIIKKYLKNLKGAEGATVLLFSTVAVQTGMPYHTSVSASKGAVEGFTRSLAAELAPEIRVNCIAPSLTETPLAERLLNTPEKINSSKERHPLKRIGAPAETAKLAAFLLSDDAAFITGQIFKADGGISSLKTN